jgi:hypothetical protein
MRRLKRLLLVLYHRHPYRRPGARRYSPGALGLTEILKNANEDPQVHTVRMITDYPWQDRWQPDKEPYMGVRIFLSSISGRMASLATSLLKKDWKVLV